MAADLRLATFETPLGPFSVAVTDAGVVATTTEDVAGWAGDLASALGTSPRTDTAALAPIGREIAAYFSGRSRRFRTPVDLRLASTPFAEAVLRAVQQIPYGELRTYGDVAAEAGGPGAARAAGGVLRRCRIELFVPCHRVVPAGPGLGAYGGAEDRRAALLRLEGAI